jgi:hypothetical protein
MNELIQQLPTILPILQSRKNQNFSIKIWEHTLSFSNSKKIWNRKTWFFWN